ncbi:MAG: hypothetical protein ACP5RS_06830, partial [Thermoplasmata archaeon]
AGSYQFYSTFNTLSNLLVNEFNPYFKNYRSFNQFKNIANAMVISESRSVAHLNGINIEHTNQSNLNRFIKSNYDK